MGGGGGRPHCPSSGVSTSQARRRHEARHLSLCRGGGGLPCCSRRRPSYPAFAPPVPPPLGLARRVLPTGTVVWSVPHPLSAASPPCRFVLGGGGRCPPLPTFIPHPSGGGGVWGGGSLVVIPSLHACRRHDASTAQARGAAPVPLQGGGHALWLPSSPFLPCARIPGGPPAGACTARALYRHGLVVRPAPSRRCLPTLPLCPRGGGAFRPPLPASPILGGRRCVGGGGGALLSSLRSTHVAGTTQAWRRHEARHLSLCRGGGLPCVTRRRPSYPECAPPGGRRCVEGGGCPCRRSFVARMSPARRRVGFRTRTAHGTTHGNYPLPCPLCSLPHPLCSLGAEQSPCLPRRSLLLVRLSGLCSPPKCPTSFALPVPSSLVLAGPPCMTLRRHTAHCTFRGGLPCGGTPPCPVPPCAAGGSLGCGAPCCPLLCSAISDPLPSG